ncbi:MAG: glycosyltransferase family 9 protein [Sphingobacteriia bacterium]|nr:MAG: glycosyltransferase family 9 protein [Sphingobacteriia bacterium]
MGGTLVIQTAFIGDVVLATALVESLHLVDPKEPIDVLVRKGNEGLFRSHPFVRKVWVWDKQNKKYAHALGLVKSFRQNHYRAVINVQRYGVSALMTVFSGAQITIGFKAHWLSHFFTQAIPHQIAADGTQHEIERNLELLKALYPQKNLVLQKPRLYPDTAATTAAAPFQQEPYCCVAPGSVWFTKTLPLAQWADLINALPETFKVYVLGGPSDKALGEALLKLIQRKGVENLAGRLDFLGAAALQQGATMNYVNDSAPMHFCSAVNAPVTAVYCSTVPGFGYGPLSTISHVVSTPLVLSCRPCGNHGKKACPENHFQCAKTIRNADLLAVLPPSANTP